MSSTMSSNRSGPQPTRRSSGRRGFTSYASALKYLEDRPNLERTRVRRDKVDAFKLDRIRAILAELGDPHTGVRTVHVAGSKGKGSTATMLSSMLRGTGHTVGLFTSPHLIDVRERIRLDGVSVSETAFRDALSKVRRAVDATREEHGEPSYFELLTAAAFLVFAELAVDIAVVEVGLGGRLDCTNVVTPEVCLLTEIQLEHTDILGDSLEQIAAEKAGIMKPGVPAVTIKQADAVLEVFKETAERVGCELLVLGTDLEFSSRFEVSSDIGPHTRVSLSSGSRSFEHLPVPLKGEHQAGNCGLALAAIDRLCDRLGEQGFTALEHEVASGLATTREEGRLEQVWDQPRILLDGAHTPESVRALVKAIGAHIRYDSMVVVFGCATDKNVDGLLEAIAVGADKIIFTQAADNPRAAAASDLQRSFSAMTPKMSQVEPVLKDAINAAARAVARDDLILVTGSFHLAGEAKRLLEDKRSG